MGYQYTEGLDNDLSHYLLWLLNLFLNLSITFKIKDIEQPFCLIKEMIISVFSNQSLDEYR